MKQKEFYGVNLKIWLKLVIASSISSVLVIPYLLELTGQSIPALPEFLGISLITFVQYGLMFALLAYLGLRISKKIEIEPTPVLSGKIKLKKYLRLSVVSGIAVGLAILFTDMLFNSMNVVLPVDAPGTIESFLASFYGGISEEVLMRLFLVPFCCLLITGAMKLLGFAKTWKHTDNVVWASVIIVAIVFGLGHLLITSVITDITMLVILRAILLNGIAGVVFGWLFYRKGLEFAMISHFSADIVIQVMFPLIVYTL